MVARRHVPGVALVAACLPLSLAWLSAPSVNCHLGGGTHAACYVFGWPRVPAWTLLALPAGLLGAVLGAVLPERWVTAAVRGPATRTLLAPTDGSLVALGPVTVAAALLGPPLFAGALTARALVWALLALPFLPFLAGSALLYAITRGALAEAALPALLVLTVPVLVAQATWLATLARVLAGAYSVASSRNSTSE